MSGKQLRAFVLMPFLDELDWAYEQLIKPAFEAAKYAVVRADDIDSQQNILKDIVTAIAESDVVVADLTGANPNVYYELGLAHALQKQVVLLSQDVQKAPFDLRSYRIIEYGDRFDQFQGALERLRKLAHDISAERVRFGSPISDFIPRTRAAPATDTADAKETSDDVAAVERTHDEIVEEDGEPGMLDLVTDTEEGAALLRREVFALFMGLFARGCVSPVLSSGGQQPSQHVPASFRRPAEPRNGTEYRRSVPLGRAPFWTFARRSGTVPWAGGQTCDGSDDRIPGT